jgi:TorA maturation chaperone TorD
MAGRCRNNQPQAVDRIIAAVLACRSTGANDVGVALMGGDTRLDEAIRAPAVDDTAVARAREYALLAALLARPPDAAMLGRLAKIEGGETPLGLAHQALAKAAAVQDAAAVAREYFELFIGVGRGELLPYGSYYQTGFLHERPLARLRADLADLGIERVEGQGEPEDHAAILCEIMAGLIAGEVAVPVERQLYFFDRHLAPWIRRFFADLEAAEAADFYRPVGTTGRVFIEIETQACAFPA